MRRTAGISVLLGAVVGAGAAAYLMVVRLLEHALWEHGDPRLPIDPWLGTLLLCAIGGLLVGLIRRRHDADSPHDLDDALLVLEDAPIDEDVPAPPPKVRWLLRSGLLGVVSLGFGASLGPEAPLLLLASGFGRRIAPILRATQDEVAYISAAGALSGMFGGPLGSAMLPIEGANRRQSATLLPYGVIAAVVGLATMLAVLPDSAGLRYELPATEPGTGRDLLRVMGWAALAAVPGTCVGLALLALLGPTRRLAERALPAPVPRGVVGGLILGGCGILTPLALFSGEHQAQDLIDEATEHTAWALLALAAIKLVATLACVATGWFGGQIFPAIFCGMAVGLATAAAFPDAAVAHVAVAGAGAVCTTVLRKPLASVLILLFFFPPVTLLALSVGVAVGSFAVQLLGDRAPQPPAPAH